MADTLEFEIAGSIYRISCPGLTEEPGPILSGFLGPKRPAVTYEVKIETDSLWKDRDDKFQTSPKWDKDSMTISLPFCDAKIDFKTRKAKARSGQYIGLFSFLRFLSAMHLMRHGGFLLHASSILTHKGAYIFSGVSGSGKTTIANLAQKDMRVMTDETSAVLKSENGYMAYATPFSGDFNKPIANTEGAIRALFFLRQDAVFGHRRLRESEAVRELFRNIIMTVSDQDLTNSLFDTLISFTRSVACYELSFKPTEQIWRYVDGIA